jgi:hypothetical protein
LLEHGPAFPPRRIVHLSSFDAFGVAGPFVLPFTSGGVSEGGWSLESLSLFTCHSMNRRLPSFRSALQMVNGSRG